MRYKNSFSASVIGLVFFCFVLPLPLWLSAQDPTPTEDGIDLSRVPNSVLTSKEVAEGWISLFDGHSLFGWRGDDLNWKAQANCLFIAQSPASILRTASQFDNFQMSFEYSSSEPFELLLRTSPKPAAGDAVFVELPATTGFTPVELRIDAKKLSVTVNEKSVVSSRVIPVLRGYIGFAYREGDLSIRQLKLRPLFAPSDGRFKIEDWVVPDGTLLKVRQENESTFSIKGGPGYLESPQQYTNFIFQMRAWIIADGNSGVFFRCIPGENMNGYESQIDHGIQSEDKYSPDNGGTGGVFRRKEARRVVGTDEAWFAKTIIAEGPHVAIWVNGYQVTDWTDKRRPNENPRRGLKTAAGTLMLQGHDPETVTRFQAIHVRELSRRR